MTCHTATYSVYSHDPAICGRLGTHVCASYIGKANIPVPEHDVKRGTAMARLDGIGEFYNDKLGYTVTLVSDVGEGSARAPDWCSFFYQTGV